MGLNRTEGRSWHDYARKISPHFITYFLFFSSLRARTLLNYALTEEVPVDELLKNEV